MLRLLHTIQLKSFVIAILIYIAIQFGNWVLAADFQKDIGSLSSSINAFNLFWFPSYMIKITLVILGGFILQNTVIKNEIIYKNTVLVFLFYLVINSLYPSLSYFSSFSVLSILSILIFREVVKFHNSIDPNYLIFKASIWVGLGSIIHPIYAATIFIVLFAFSRFQPAKIRPIALLLLGFAFPWALLAVATYLIPEFVHQFTFRLFEFNNFSHLVVSEIIVLALFLLLATIATFAWIGNAQRNTVKGRRIIQTIVSILIVFGAISLSYLSASKASLELLSMPLSLVLAYFFSVNKRIRLRNFLFLLLLGSIFILRYKELLML